MQASQFKRRIASSFVEKGVPVSQTPGALFAGQAFIEAVVVSDVFR